MKTLRVVLLAGVLGLVLTMSPITAGVSTPHLISFQGRALDSSGQPIASGNIAVRIYDAATGGTLVYDSGTDFNGSISNGIYSVVLGSVTPLSLDNTKLYYLEADINGTEVVGDTAGGRQQFYPGGGSHARSDLESRLTTLEDLVFFTCDPGTFDLNMNPSDECEFTLDTDGIYVSTDDTGASDSGPCGIGPDGTGSGNYPCATLQRGINRAVSEGRSTVYVADGTYTASGVTLVDGVSLRGGYHANIWERHLSTTHTVIRISTTGTHKKAISADGVTTTTVIEGFVIYADATTNTAGNSYAVYLKDSPGVSLLNNVIFAAHGGPGSPGTGGPSGLAGMDGGAGLDAYDTGATPCYDSRQLSNGGVRTCFGGNISGGDGGGNQCRPDFDTETSGTDGANGRSTGGGGSSGTGGDAGDDGIIAGVSPSCYLPSSPPEGADGTDGQDGTNGFGGSGASNDLGTVVANEWVGVGGQSGGNGTPGGGGGGGGAGGGSESQNVSFDDRLGAHGGGGGSGGCAGTAGNSGTAGGGSFAIFVTGGTAPTIQFNRIYLSAGGAGGGGGSGGSGGAGGTGGLGGSSGGGFCMWEAGDGADGGNGGHGGGGGGGAGGVAMGIYLYSVVSPPDYTTNNQFWGGVGGPGGPSGPAMSNPGTNGVTGRVDNVSVN